MSKSALAVALGMALAMSTPAHAEGDNTGPDDVRVRFNGRVPALCQIGGSATARGAFEMVVLIDTSSGFLKRSLTAPDKVIEDTWCNAPSEIEVRAVELTPQASVARLRDGFANAVHFTATATGWSASPAFYRTDGAATQQSAIQDAPQPRVTTLVINVSDFRMRDGAALRPIASRSYLGAVIVTLRPKP